MRIDYARVACHTLLLHVVTLHASAMPLLMPGYAQLVITLPLMMRYADDYAAIVIDMRLLMLLLRYV